MNKGRLLKMINNHVVFSVLGIIIYPVYEWDEKKKIKTLKKVNFFSFHPLAFQIASPYLILSNKTPH